MFNAIRNLLTDRKSTGTRTPSRKTRLSLESMERRDCMSTYIGMSSDTLFVWGDTYKDVVTVTQNDALNTVVVEVTEYVPGSAPNVTTSPPFSSSYIHTISVNLGNGDDTFNYKVKAGTNGGNAILTNYKNVLIETGAGYDSVWIDLQKTVGNGKVTSIVDMSFDIKTGSEKDSAYAAFGPYVGGDLSYKLDLGDGSDQTGTTYLYGDLTANATADVTMTGGAQGDSLKFNMQYDGYLGAYDSDGRFTIDAGSSLAVNLDGKGGDDTVTASVEAAFIGRMDMTLHGGFGNDDVYASINRLIGSASGSANATVFGDADNDNLGLSATSQGQITRSLDTFIVDGGTGWDTIAFPTTSNVAKKNIDWTLITFFPI